jgi:hypothetical protein
MTGAYATLSKGTFQLAGMEEEVEQQSGIELVSVRYRCSPDLDGLHERSSVCRLLTTRICSNSFPGRLTPLMMTDILHRDG